MLPTDTVVEMYEAHPYPSALPGTSLIHDLANAIAFLSPRDELCGRLVLDAGCGTGHRLIALAKEFPRTKFVGIDVCANSLKIAKSLAARHAVMNVEFTQHDLLEPLPDRYHVITSTGVMHHLERPEIGIRAAYEALTDDGFLMLWMYHSYGEAARLLDRQLARILWCKSGSPKGPGRLDILKRLGLSVPRGQYGTNSSRQVGEVDQEAIDVDAYLHPVVHAYTFDQVFSLLAGCGTDWIAANGINWNSQSKLIDLGRVCHDPFFTVTAADLFTDEVIQSTFECLTNREKLAVIELRARPTGFTVVAGRSRSYESLESRIQHNLIHDEL